MKRIISDYLKFLEHDKVVDRFFPMVFETKIYQVKDSATATLGADEDGNTDLDVNVDGGDDKSNTGLQNTTAVPVESPNSKKAKEIMADCRKYVFLFQPFFATLLIKLPFIETKDPRYKTMCTNGIAIWYNADFVVNMTNKYSKGSIVWVICHEIMHCALGHVERLSGRNAKLWNYATDYAINLMIGPDLVKGTDSLGDGIQMPGGYGDDCFGLYNKEYVGMSSEHIYDILLKDPKNQEEISNKHSPIDTITDEAIPIPADVWDQLPKEIQDEIRGKSSDSVPDETDKEGKPLNPDDNTDAEGKPLPTSKIGQAKPGEGKEEKYDKSAIERMNKRNVDTASRNIGKASSNIMRGFNREMNKKVDWKKILRKYINAISDRVKYVLPNRRYASKGIYVYGTKKDIALDTAIVVFDTSGSVDDNMLGQMAAELKNIREETNCKTLYVLYCDAAIRHVDTFKRADKINIKAAGGGGTSFVPPFKWIRENVLNKHKKVEIVIYMTDGHGDFPTAPPYNQNVIWLIIDSQVTPPFGKIVRIDTKD